MLPELPVEVLAQVLCLLPCAEHVRAAAVCRRLRALVEGGETWVCVALPNPLALGLPPRDAWRALLRRAGGALRRLDVSGVCADGESVLALVRDALTAAQRAALTNLRYTCRLLYAALSAEEATALLAACPALRSLDVDARCTVAPDDALTALLRSPSRPAALRVTRLYVDDSAELSVWKGECTETLRLLSANCEELVPVPELASEVHLEALHAALPPTGPGPRLSVSITPNMTFSEIAAHAHLAGLRVTNMDNNSEWTEVLFLDLTDVANPLHTLSVEDAYVDQLSVAEQMSAGLRAVGICLRRLELTGCVMYESGHQRRAHPACTLLANALADCPCLEELSLRGSGFKAADAEALALLLRASTSLRSLDVSCCELGCAGVTALADALASPSALLTRLAVGSVSGRAVGARALARMLAVNTHLRELRAGGFRDYLYFRAVSWDKASCNVLLAALPRASPAFRLLTLPVTLFSNDGEEEEEGGESRHDVQLRLLTIKALQREHPRCAEVKLTDEILEFSF